MSGQMMGAARAGSSIVAIALTALLLPGCTTEIRTYNPTAAAPPPGHVPAGFSYWLPKSSIDTSVGLLLTECTEVKEWDKFAPSGKPVLQPVAAVGFKLVGDITAGTERGQQVQLDYRKMAKMFKTGGMKIERHPNGMLKSINASLADESPDAIATVAKSAASLAALLTGNPTLALAGMPIPKAPPKFRAHLSYSEEPAKPPPTVSVSYETCSAEAVALLSESKQQSEAADAADIAIDKALAEVVSLLATPGGVGVAEYAALSKAQATLKVQVDRKTAASKALAANVAKRTLTLSPPKDDKAETAPRNDILRWQNFTAEPIEIDRFHNRLFGTETMVLPVSVKAGDLIPEKLSGQTLTLETASTPAGGGDTPAKPSIQIVKAGIRKLLGDMAKASLELPCKANVAASCFSPDTPLSATLLGEPRLNPPGICTKEADPRCTKTKVAQPHGLRVNMIAADRGILYVEPIKRKLVLQGPRLTLRKVADQLTMAFDEAKPVATKIAAFPEQGQFWALPLRSGFGEKVALEAIFAEDGSLVTGNFTKSASAGKAVADTAKNVLEGIIAYREKQDSLQVSAIEQQTKVLKAEKDQKDTLKALNPEEKSLIDQQIEALQKEKTIAEAKVAIAEAAKKLNELANPKT